MREKILLTIELLREELKELIEEKGSFVDEEVIKKSQELDKLLNKFSNYMKEQNFTNSGN